MRRFFFIAIGTMVLTVSQAARAEAPALAEGSFFATAPPVIVDVQNAGPNTILTQTNTFALTGDLNGTYANEQRAVIRPDGEFVQNGFGTFTGTVNGVAGTLDFREVSSGNLSTTFDGHVVTTAGSGGLANVRCNGTIEGDAVSGTGTYAVRCH